MAMRLGILGRKVGMTQIFDEAGAIIPVTVIDTKDCFVTQVKTKDRHGYSALQVAIGKRKPQNVNKSQAGHFKKAGIAAAAYLQELRFDENTDLSQMKGGQPLSAGMFQKGDRVDVSGLTRGKGFTGVIKRYGYSGKDATHGTSKYFRHGGSNGTNTFPGRVLRNKGMPGHKGMENVTVPFLEIVQVRPAENLLLRKGAVPGHRNSVLLISNTKRAKAPEGRSLITA